MSGPVGSAAPKPDGVEAADFEKNWKEVVPAEMEKRPKKHTSGDGKGRRNR